MEEHPPSRWLIPRSTSVLGSLFGWEEEGAIRLHLDVRRRPTFTTTNVKKGRELISTIEFDTVDSGPTKSSCKKVPDAH